MNRKRNIQFDPSGAPASPPAAETVAEIAVETTEPVVTEPVVSNDPEEHWAQVEAALTGKKPDEKPADPPAKTPEEIAAEKVVADKLALEKPADENAETADETLAVPEIFVPDETPTETWAQVAADAGITPPENPDDYEGLITNFKTAITLAKEEGKKEAESPDPDKFSPDERIVLSALKGGKKLADIITPLQKYSDTLAMSDRELIELNLKNTPNWTDDMVADQMAIIDQTPGMEAIEGTKLRNVVTQMRTNEYNQIIADGEKAWKDESARQSQKIEKEKSDLIAEIKSRKTFMGEELNDQHIEAIVKNVNAGKYDKILNTPRSITDQIMQEEFGPKRMASLLAKKDKDGKLAVAKKLANTPVESGGSHVEASKKLIDPNDFFAGVEEHMKGKKISGSTFG